MPRRTLPKAQEERPPLQPPEAGREMPNPEELAPFGQQAATGPMTPAKLTTPTAPTKVTQPLRRGAASGFDASKAKKKRPSQLGAVITLYPIAMARASSLGTSLIGECAMANGLGNQEPSKLLVGFSDDNSQVYLMPVGPESSQGVEVSYHQGQAYFNLQQAFQEEGRGGKKVEEGYWERYHLWRDNSMETILGTTGYAVFFDLTQRDKGRSGTRDGEPGDEAPKAKKEPAPKSTAAKTKAEAKGKADERPAGAETAAQSAAEAGEQALWRDMYDEIAAEREVEIQTLEERLKEYERRFGKL